MAGHSTKIELNAVIVAADAAGPKVLLQSVGDLPSGPFGNDHPTLEQGLRAWAGLPLGYVEQLYTFADRNRQRGGARVVSIGYLALMRQSDPPGGANWSSWYNHFPWEDWRQGVPAIVVQSILPQLRAWQKKASTPQQKKTRGERIEIAFPRDAKGWNDELVLQRYELLWEAGLVQEAEQGKKSVGLGTAMPHDHRRILATGMARLRAKIKYRPVVFELLPDQFTLLQLQNVVEALAGLRLHKQNFRRLVGQQGLVEETGTLSPPAAGRPAKLFTFRREVLLGRATAGTKLPRS